MKPECEFRKTELCETCFWRSDCLYGDSDISTISRDDLPNDIREAIEDRNKAYHTDDRTERTDAY